MSVHPAAHAHEPSASQRAAIQSAAGPLLVLAGPGAGKTFCLIERIRYLLEELHVPAGRICGFTFTNKAAGEIADRLTRRLGDAASDVKTGTIHAFCAELLREFGDRVELRPGFGIADDRYQRAALRRLGYDRRWINNLLARFGAHRLRNEPFAHAGDAEYFAKYERFLAERNVVDFDTLVIRTAALLADPDTAREVRQRWDCVLVDEFQDLNPLQYSLIRALGSEHRHVFAVGDEEQSIYSWAGADPRVFRTFMNDFDVVSPVSLRENRRCSRDIVEHSRRLIGFNTPMFDQRKELQAEHESPFPVSAHTFATAEAELAWIVADVRRDHAEHGLQWGDVALLYRRHDAGAAAEASFLAAGLPCRLAQGRALSEDTVVAYIVAALRVISTDDDLHDEGFFAAVLPATVLDVLRAGADEARCTLREHLEARGRTMPREDPDTRRILRALATLRNLRAVGMRHETLTGLVEEVLTQRVGTHRTPLEERHDELSDPADDADVVRLAERMREVLASGRTVWLERTGGAGIALRSMLVAAGFARVSLAEVAPPNAECVVAADGGALGLPLALFKALQLLRSRAFPDVFRDFTAVDIETTDKDVATAEVVDIAAVRVRNGMVVAEYTTFVKPLGRIMPGAQRTHGISDADVADAPSFAEMWPAFRAFCGDDVLVAHNGHHFDFPILRRMGNAELCTYDTLPLARELVSGSAKLVDLAERFGVDPGQSHRALADTRALAHVCLALHALKLVVSRKTMLANLLDHLGLALVLWPGDPHPEAELLRDVCRIRALGRYSDCLEQYDEGRTAAEDNLLPTREQVIEWLGGAALMERLRMEKSAEERYPVAMARMRGLLDQCARGTLHEQIAAFLDRVALSQSEMSDGRDHVNLLTLHSTKGLEFSRVYILGVEDDRPRTGKTSTDAQSELEEARRLLYVGMTRARDRLVLTHARERNGMATAGHRFLDEMELVPQPPP